MKSTLDIEIIFTIIFLFYIPRLSYNKKEAYLKLFFSITLVFVSLVLLEFLHTMNFFEFSPKTEQGVNIAIGFVLVSALPLGIAANVLASIPIKWAENGEKYFLRIFFTFIAMVAFGYAAINDLNSFYLKNIQIPPPPFPPHSIKNHARDR